MRELVQKAIRDYPGWIVGVFLVVTLIFGFGIRKITIATDVANWFSEDDPRVVLFDETSDTFGSSDYVMVAVETQDVYSLDGLAALDRLTEALSEVEGVDSVRSLTSIEDITGSDWGIEISPMLAEVPTTQQEVDAFRRKVEGDHQLAGKLVSDDGNYTLILITLDQYADNDQTVNGLRAAVEENRGDMTVYLAGSPVLNQVMNETLLHDLALLTPLVVALILGILFFSFRNWQGVLLPLLTMVVSTIWTVGLMGFLDVPISQLSAILPAVFTSVGSAYGIHVLHRYRGEVAAGGSNSDTVKRVVSQVGPAVFMAGATTAAGFLSNSFSSIVRIREFGMLTAFGVLVALAFSILVIPSILVFGGRRSERGWSRSVEQRESASLGKLGNAVANHSKAVLAIALGLVLVAAVGLPRLVVDTNFINYFDRDTETRGAFDLVQDHFGGTDTIQVVIEGDIVEPEVLRAMENAQEQLKDTPHLSTPLSVVDLVKRVSRVLHADDPAYEVIPDTREAVAQYLLLLSMSGDSMLSQLLTIDHQVAKIEVVAASTSTSEQQEVLDHVYEIADELSRAPGVDAVEVTGLPLLGQAMSDLIIEGQIQSLILSLVTVFLLVWVIVGSPLGSLACLTPIIITVVVNFGVMGWFGLSFNVVTALVTSVAVGMGIDYSIHMYTRYREEVANCGSIPEAVARAAATTGYAVLLNAGAVTAGFLVLLLSAFQPMREFGALIAATMVVSSVSAIAVLPALLVTRAARAQRRVTASN